MRYEALRWLSEALWDYETAIILLREKRFNAVAFYSHQASEKAAKALLYHVNEAPWGYSVRILLERYFEKAQRVAGEELMACARELDRHYIPSRYPNAHPMSTPHEAYDEEVAKRALVCAEKIIAFTKGVLGHE